MRYNDNSFLQAVIGMPLTHAVAFMTVAREQDCVILVRATGPTCHGPLLEGYDTKGYRIHGKSCDWGPMAGFVLRDPRLSKKGLDGADGNRRAHAEALTDAHERQGWRASTVPLVLSRNRIQWLRSKGLINAVERAHGVPRVEGRADRAGVAFNYALIRGAGELYSVCFDYGEGGAGAAWRQEADDHQRVRHPANPARYECLLAMTNPPGHCGLARGKPDYLRAVTGDYDLWAVWPRATSYDARPGGLDERPLGTVRGSNGDANRRNVAALERHFTEGDQGTKLGNITDRIYLICQLINSMTRQTVLWHSDEAARPFLNDVDLPVIAFTPAGCHYGIDSIYDLRKFIQTCQRGGIHVTLSEAWAQPTTGEFPNRLGRAYDHLVPADGARVVAKDWYNA